jgi:hypothetical protein
MAERLNSPSFGFLTIDITPKRSIPLAGYSARSASFRGVDKELEANVLIILSNGAPVIFIAVDTLFVDADFHSALARSIEIDSGRLLLVASHTHNAPALCQSTPMLGMVDREYFESCIQRISDAIRTKMSTRFTKLEAASNTFAGKFSVNRRRPSWVLNYDELRRGSLPKLKRQIALTRNPHGFADNTLRVWALFSISGKMEAIIWSIAAHPAFYPEANVVSPDFPGTVRSKLRSQFGNDLSVFFVPGFAGSAIPDFPSAFPATLKQAVARCLPFHPLLPYQTMRSYLDYCTTIAQNISTLVQGMNAAVDCSYIAIESLQSPAIFVDRGGARISLNISALGFGELGSMVVSSGELVGEWLPLLNIESTSIATGYGAGRPLYVPTSAQLEEGGYEVEGFQMPFGLCGSFSEDIDSSVKCSFAKVLSNITASL